MINASRARNYIMKISDGIAERYQIYMLGRFDYENTTELIGELGAIVHNLTPQPIYEQKSKIISPYDIDDKENTIIDIFIDSNGGLVSTLHNITTMLNIAKMRGAIIRTTVLSAAYSCGSILAIQGTPGYRIMSEDAEHLIHYGKVIQEITSDADKNNSDEYIERNKDKLFSKYEKHTDTPKKMLNEIKKYPLNKQIGAYDCLKYGLCDWIIRNDGTLTGRNK